MNSESATPSRFRTSSARVSLTLGVILFILGQFLACACPGWFLLAAAFALVATIAGERESFRIWSAILLLLSLVCAWGHWQGEKRQKQRLFEIRQRIEKSAGP